MSQSLYTTFGNEISYEIRRDKLVKFLENNTINFPLPEASLEILVNMLASDDRGVSADKLDIVFNRLTSIGFAKSNARALAVALIKVADAQGVHPISYFEINEDSILLAENTYKAINELRPTGNQIGLKISTKNNKSKIANKIRP